jgi:hypothetical protein
VATVTFSFQSPYLGFGNHAESNEHSVMVAMWDRGTSRQSGFQCEWDLASTEAPFPAPQPAGRPCQLWLPGNDTLIHRTRSRDVLRMDGHEVEFKEA